MVRIFCYFQSGKIENSKNMKNQICYIIKNLVKLSQSYNSEKTIRKKLKEKEFLFR